MSLRKIVAKQLARRARKRINRWAENPIETQQRVFEQLIQKAKHTALAKPMALIKFKIIKTLLSVFQLRITRVYDPT